MTNTSPCVLVANSKRILKGGTQNKALTNLFSLFLIDVVVKRLLNSSTAYKT